MRRTPVIALALLAALAGGACTPMAPGDDALVDDGSDDGKSDRGGHPAFREVDSVHTTATFRRYIGDALALLEADAAPIARLTAQSIREGRVEIDELADLTCWDFDRLRNEIEGSGLTPADWLTLHKRGSPAVAKLASEVDGYMWANRVYVARGLTPKRLAATLIHEVNHVINRSEVGYWDDLPTSAFRHEYRAFYAERLFDPATYRNVDLVDYVVDLYGLDGLPADVRAKPLTPSLLPDAAAWAARNVAADIPDIVAECPTYK